jgi:tRNA nucleotidyltransferase (CCA-adding enzyme)
MEFDKLESSVLKKIMPTAEENAKISSVQKKVEKKIGEASKKFGLNDVKPILVGSVSKDTHLKQVDLDIFMMFPPDTPRAELEKFGLKIGYEIIPDAMELYAEHPYLRGELDGISLDIVPCYHIKDSSLKLSAVDRTPFHMEYVIQNLKEELKADVRLFKQFLKGIGAYGAEIRVQGFSGYLCEVLVMEFGGFHHLLEAVRNWDVPGTTIIIPKILEDGFDRATLTKFTEPLIVIDPIDRTRNVAAPVSEEILELFKVAAGTYLENPNEKFFFPNVPEPFTDEVLQSGLSNLQGLIIGLELHSDSLVPDILYGQVRKSLNAVIKILEHYDFSVARSDFFVDEQAEGKFPVDIRFVLLLDRYELPDESVHRGPPLTHPNSTDFLNKWRTSRMAIDQPYEKEGRWYVNIQREYTSAVQLLKEQFEDLNHGKQLNEIVQKGNYRILVDEELLIEPFKKVLTVFIENKLPWEY